MQKNRLEAFSDGVIAILITIMVLELKVPQGSDWQSLHVLAPTFLAYVISFIYLGIYWNNHHHLLHATHDITGGILLANLHLLFWLSLLPFVSEWMGEHHSALVPVLLYGIILLFAAVSFYILAEVIKAHDHNARVREAIGKDIKKKCMVYRCCTLYCQYEIPQRPMKTNIIQGMPGMDIQTACSARRSMKRYPA